MKKSEIYKLMVETLLDELPDLNNINSLDIAVYMMSVLDKIEQAGMLPPDSRPESIKLTTNPNKVKREEEIQQYINRYHTWEPE